MEKHKVAIVGYGNIGKYAIKADWSGPPPAQNCMKPNT